MRKPTLYVLIILFLLSACSKATPPPPTPTATPIPGFVGGEEEEAYTSFVEFYKAEVVDCSWEGYAFYDVATFLDEDYSGKAVYVGDGLWRFYVQIGTVNASDQLDEPSYSEKMVEWQSLPDRTWRDKCDRNLRDDEEYYSEEYNYEDLEEPPEQDFDYAP